MLGSHGGASRSHEIARKQAMAKWLKRGLGGLVAAVTLVYVAACCSLIFGSGAAGSGGMAAAVVPRFLRSPTETEEKAEIRAELGHGTWNMLHRLAAQFDKAPTPARRQEVADFFRLFGEFYPCEWCAKHFREMLAEHPPQTANNRELSLWLCQLHNIVNDRLGKPAFPCTLDALKERWGKCGCFDPPSNATDATGAGAPVVAAAARLLRQPPAA
jgi:hypothetical protein